MVQFQVKMESDKACGGFVNISHQSASRIYAPQSLVGYVCEISTHQHSPRRQIGNNSFTQEYSMVLSIFPLMSERIRLPDGTRVHSLSKGAFHIYDLVDQEMTDGIPPYILSISPDRDWITGKQGEHILETPLNTDLLQNPCCQINRVLAICLRHDCIGSEKYQAC